MGFFARAFDPRQSCKLGVLITDVRINDQIRVREVRLVGQNGEQIGVVPIGKALSMAEYDGLDLVEVAPEAHPPVCKLMDYGKYKYEAAQKARDQRRNQASTLLKEIRLGLKIDQHDYEVKMGHIRRFLDGGDKVKIMIKFRGREQSRPEMGTKLLERIAEEIAEDGVVESAPSQDGRNMTMVLGPVKKKTDAISAQRKRRESERQAKRDAKAERAAKNQQRVAEQANAPVLKPLTFAQLGEGNLSAAAVAGENTKAAASSGKAPKLSARKPPAKKTTPKASASTQKKTTAKTQTSATGAKSSKATGGKTESASKPVVKKAAAKTTAGKTEKPKARAPKAEKEEIKNAEE